MTKGLLCDLGLLLPFTFCFDFVPTCVYYKHKVIIVKFSELTHHEIFREEFFGEFYKDTFSDCPSNMYTIVSQKMIVLSLYNDRFATD